MLVAVEESPEDLVMTGDTLGLDLSEAIKEGRLRVTDATRPMDGPMVVTGDYDISGLTHRIEAIVKQTGAQAIVLDSATALFSPRPPQELLRSLFFQLIHAFKKLDLTSVVLAEAAEDYGQLTTLGRRGLRLRRGGHPAQHHRRRAPPPLHRDQQVPPQPPLQGRVPLHHHRQRPHHLPPRRQGPAGQRAGALPERAARASTR